MTIIGGILFVIGLLGAGLIWTGYGAYSSAFTAIPMDFRAYLITAAVGVGLYLWGRRPKD